MIVLAARARQVSPHTNPENPQPIKSTINPRRTAVKTRPSLNPLSSIITNNPIKKQESSKRFETQTIQTARLGNSVTPLITYASNVTCTPTTLFAPASACWRTKVITIQPPTRLVPLWTPTEARMTLELAASVMSLTLLTSIVYLHPLSISWGVIRKKRTPSLHLWWN